MKQRHSNETRQGWYAAIYIHISTMQQRGDKRDDGYSVEDQMRSNIAVAVKSGLVFGLLIMKQEEHAALPSKRRAREVPLARAEG